MCCFFLFMPTLYRIFGILLIDIYFISFLYNDKNAKVSARLVRVLTLAFTQFN